MTQNPLLLARDFFITILYHKLAKFSCIFFLFFHFFTQIDNLCCFSLSIFSYALHFVSRETFFALQYNSCAQTVLKMSNLWRKQIISTCYKSKHKFFYVFSFICKKSTLSTNKADTKRGDRYIYIIFIVVAELTVITARWASHA